MAFINVLLEAAEVTATANLVARARMCK
jgi:hypothetical protein